MLRLQAKTVTLLVHLPAFAGDGAIEKIAAVELDARFAGVDLHHSPAGRFIHARGQNGTRTGPIEYPIVVVTPAQLELLVRIFYSGSHRGPPVKVHRSSADSAELARRNEAVVNRRKLIRIEH